MTDAVSIPDFTAQLAELVRNTELTTEELAAQLATLWGTTENIVLLFQQMQAVIAIRSDILSAFQAALGLKGTVASVSALPAVAAERDAYKIENVLDTQDGHLFVRVAGVWTDLGRLTGSTGRSAYEVAVAHGFEGTEAAYAQGPIDKAILAATAAEEADAVKTATDLVRTQTLEAKGLTETATTAAQAVVAAGGDILAARDGAVAARDEAASTVAPFTAQVKAVGNAADADIAISHEFADESGAVLTEITSTGHYRGRGLTLRDAAGADVAITSDAGTVQLPRTALGGLPIDQIDDPGFVLVVTTEDGAVIAEIPEQRSNVNTNDVAELLRRTNATRPYLLTRRRPTFAFIIDDLNDSDAAAMAIFEEYGIPLGLALQSNHINVDNIGLYQVAYLHGASILAHSVTHADMRTATSTLTDEQAEAQIRDSKLAIENWGFRVSGWVTPYSSLKPAWLPLVQKYFGYGFTGLNGTAWNTTVEPCSMGRVGLEALLTGSDPSAVSARVATAIANTELVVFYMHKLPSETVVGGESVLKDTHLRTILADIKARRDAGTCLVLSPDEAVAQYYKTPYA